MLSQRSGQVKPGRGASRSTFGLRGRASGPGGAEERGQGLEDLVAVASEGRSDVRRGLGTPADGGQDGRFEGRPRPGPGFSRRTRRRPPSWARAGPGSSPCDAGLRGPAVRSAGGRTTVLSSIRSGRMRAIAALRARMWAGESLTPLTSMTSSLISPGSSSRKRTRPSMILRFSSEAWGRLMRRKAAAGTASSDGTTMSASARSLPDVLPAEEGRVGQHRDGYARSSS